MASAMRGSGRERHGSYVRSAVAIIATLTLVSCGVLARHHEANHLHVRGPAGALSHALRIDCQDTTQTPTHVHRLPADQGRDVGECGLTSDSIPSSSLAMACQLVVAELPSCEMAHPEPTGTPVRAASLLLVAPKTSPPRAA